MPVLTILLATLVAQDVPAGSDLATVRYFAPGDTVTSTIEVTNDWPLEGPPPTLVQFNNSTWYAKRSGPRGSTVLDSRSCPAIGDRARAFRELPPIAPQSAAARILGELPVDLQVIVVPAGPTVSFKTYAASVEVSNVGPISAWGSELIAAFVTCENE